MDFDSLPTDPAPVAKPTQQAQPIDFDSMQDDNAKLQSQYGGLAQQVAAGAESFASNATLGASRALENYTGLTTPEAQAGRAAANPWTEGIAGFGGTAALMALSGGASTIAEMPTLATKLVASGAIGGALGGGQLVNDTQMGDPSINAQKIISYVGLGSILGSGIELGLAGISPVASGAKSLVKKAAAKVLGTEAAPEAAEAIGQAAAAPVVNASPEVKVGAQPTTLQDIQAKVAAAKESGAALELPEKSILQADIAKYPMQYPVHPLQLESLDNQQARDIYKTAMEMGDSGPALQQYEGLQKAEIVKNTQNDIQSLAGGEKVTPNAVEGGNIASDYFTNAYQTEKKLSGELVGQARSLSGEGFDHLNGVVSKWSEAVPQIGDMLEASDDGIEVKPYKTSMGMTKSTYSAVKEAVNSLQENPQDFGSLFNIRKGLSNGVNFLTSDADTVSEIARLKSSMMDYMQDMTDKSGIPELRNSFKRYAVNQENGAIIKKAFGADLNDSYESALSKVKPENIGDNIFKNTANVNAAKQILPPEQFNHILANWLAEAKEKVTDKGVFSSNKFNTFLKSNQDSLNAAFADKPGLLDRIKTGIEISRILPDSSPINPSGTAKTLINYIKQSDSLTGAGMNGLKWLKDKVYGNLVEKQVNLQNLNNSLQGKAANYSVLNRLSDMTMNVDKKIAGAAKSIFGSTPAETVGTSAIPAVVDKYNKHAEDIQRLGNDPHAMMDHLEKLTGKISQAAPNITNGLTAATINSIQFLNSKLPKPNNEFPFAESWEPSDSQKEKFNRYYAAVSDPLIALKEVKQGSLNTETMEALQAVHPDLLGQMRNQVMENINPKKKDLPYNRQIALSKFLGQPMNNSMMPQIIASNQATFVALSQMKAQQQAQNTKRVNQNAMNHMKVASRAATETQSLEDENV